VRSMRIGSIQQDTVRSLTATRGVGVSALTGGTAECLVNDIRLRTRSSCYAAVLSLTRSMSRLAPILVVSSAALAIAGCGGAGRGTSAHGGSGASTSSAIQIGTRGLPRFGSVLISGQGRTLYIFLPDRRAKVTCTGACALTWPPAKLPAGAAVSTSGGAKLSLVGSAPDPEGGRVLTYAGWPLYTYVADPGAGSTSREALSMNGGLGLWYAIAPSGKPITAPS
jgi:predicted lipoprotein with Yx(FWY)xxD motif